MLLGLTQSGVESGVVDGGDEGAGSAEQSSECEGSEANHFHSYTHSTIHRVWKLSHHNAYITELTCLNA